MKIGILTFHDTTNFGSLLQTYGLYKAISNLGHDCDVIDYECPGITKREIPKPFRFSLNPKKIAKELLYTRKLRKKYLELSRFLHCHINLSPRYTTETIKNCEGTYDRIIIGSDIVWGLDITNGDLTYFLDFVKDSSKKYAFSASIGSGWSTEEKKMLCPLLQDFKQIAVREEQAIKWVKESSGVDAQLVCDPTMLLSGEEWARIASAKYKNDKYVLVYFDTNNKDCLRKAKEIAQRNSLKVKLIHYGLPIKEAECIAPLSLEDFLALIKNATFIVTASYHGLLFSLYFEREVIYFNRAHKSRMESLGMRLGISDRDGAMNPTFHKMSYEIINRNIAGFRNDSLCILKSMLYD